jgi:hypothetical protein
MKIINKRKKIIKERREKDIKKVAERKKQV